MAEPRSAQESEESLGLNGVCGVSLLNKRHQIRKVAWCDGL